MFRRCNWCRAITETFKRERFTISRLTSGLRVITIDEGNAVTSMGLFVKNGPRYEDEHTAGSSAVLESLPLLGNELHNGEEISTTIGALGNAFKVDNKRESMSFVLMTPSYHRKDGLELLNGMCLHPTQNKDIFDQAKEDTIKRATLASRDTTNMCFELVHEAGWSGKGLGKPTIPSVPLLEQLTLENFTKFHRHHTRPERAVVAATGIPDHDTFVREVETALQFCCDGEGVKEESAPYTGGTRLVQNNTLPDSLSKFEEKDFSHVALFFRGVVMSSPEYYTISTMQSMLGGGMAFSSGGPGKGMHTKLFREVLSRAGWVNGLECITAWYSDTGLIGMYGTTEHANTAKLVNVIVQQALRISEQVSENDLAMAKNQLLSQIILLGEGREQLLMDMGYQLLTQNFIITPTETMEGSAKVKMSDIQRMHKQILNTPFTYVVLGNVKNVPSKEQLHEVFLKTSAKL